MSDTIPLAGFCPSTTEDVRVQPTMEDDSDQYVCPDCGRALGDEVSVVRNNFRTHAVKVQNA